MLTFINKTYLLVAILLYFILSPKVSGEYILITFFSVLSFLCYFTILHINTIMNQSFYKKRYLVLEVFSYVLLFGIMQNLISYFYTGNFYVFSNSDAVFYHESTMEILDMSFSDGIKHYLSYMDFDDLGMILILYPLYHIIPSNIVLNIFYLFVAIITANSLFQLSQNFMTKKYAFLASLSYSLSSFVIFFHTTGLKESVMVMLVVLSFDFYYRFVKRKTVSSLILSLIFIGMIMFFRPAISAMIIVSIGLGTLFAQKSGLGIKVVSFLIFIFLISIGDSILAEIDKYTTGGFDTLMEAREVQGMIIGSIPFSYTVNILSQSIGPLPTVVSDTKILTMFYTSGLIYRVLLAFPFWLGVVFIFKNKYSKLYTLVLFIIMEMSALTFLLDGLELRITIPHIPIVFVVSFWFLNQFDTKIIQFKKEKKFNFFFKFSMFILVCLMFFWNFR